MIDAHTATALTEGPFSLLALCMGKPSVPDRHVEITALSTSSLWRGLNCQSSRPHSIRQLRKPIDAIETDGAYWVVVEESDCTPLHSPLPFSLLPPISPAQAGSFHKSGMKRTTSALVSGVTIEREIRLVISATSAVTNATAHWSKFIWYQKISSYDFEAPPSPRTLNPPSLLVLFSLISLISFLRPLSLIFTCCLSIG